MSLKPRYVYFYSSDDGVKGLMNQSPFNWEEPIYFRESKELARIEYEHFDVHCYKVKSEIGINERFRGIKAWSVLLEDIVYDSLSMREVQYMLTPMMCGNDILGGNMKRVSIYRGEMKKLIYDEEKGELVDERP